MPRPGYMLRKGRRGPHWVLEAGGDGGREQEMQQRTASTWPGMARLLQLRATGISSAGEDVEKLKLKVFQVGMLRW